MQNTADHRDSVSARVPPTAVAIVFGLALLVRLLVPFLGGGLGGRYDNDPAVYYGAADAMLSGLAPYKDFYLVHPPLLPLLLTPFAAIGRATTDHTGFVLGNLAFSVLGAVNAVLALLLARALGAGRRASIAAGLFYAVWFGAVAAEFDMRLEPLGNTLFLLGLLLAARARRADRTSLTFAAGVLLGLTVTVKIWWALPIVVLLAEAVIRRRWRECLVSAAGSIVAVVVVCVPFAAIAGSRMWTMVVASQVGRYRSHGSLAARVHGLIVVAPAEWTRPELLTTVVVVVVLLTALAAVLAWRLPAARVFVVLLVGQVVAVLAISSYYAYYDDWLAVSVAAVVAAAATSLRDTEAATLRLSGRLVAGLLVVVSALLCAVGLARSGNTFVAGFPHRARLVRVAREHGGCMMANSPVLLVQADALTRSFTPPCHDVVDVTSPAVGALGSRLRLEPVHGNPYYNGYLARYLTSGDSAMLTVTGYGLTPAGLHAVTCAGVATRAGGLVLWRTGPCSRRLAASLPRP